MEARQFQTIVKLKDKGLDARSGEVIARLERIAGARIEYVQPMSGDAHVIRLMPVAPTTYEQSLQKLRDSGLIEYAEQDLIERLSAAPAATVRASAVTQRSGLRAW